MDTIDDVLDILRGRRIAVLTGAGISTDSGIPDYRGAGTVRRTPMTFQQFLGSEESRARYWAGSHLGWRRFMSAQPNAGHLSLSALERRGAVTGVVTQNVDGLHRRAGSNRVVELHGSMGTVVCVRCGQEFGRGEIAERLTEANPWLELPADVVLQPDGDVDTDRLDGFRVPPCPNCGGILKPDVVFFGELVPRPRFHAAIEVVKRSDALLIAGSSLAVNSGVRLMDHATRRGLPVVILNRGETKGDQRSTVRLEGGTSELLAAIEARW
ncbi:NAD-dependent SIR2 family protein deacetylase [Cryobacterium mesophilum]|nr:NAD-dependent SIR2 family protein deacetylase [Terrimesophilobacter mesophilus]